MLKATFENSSESIHSVSFPIADESLAKDSAITIGVQLNGKVRGTVTIAPEASKETVWKAINSSPDLSNRLAGKEIQKTIYVPKRIFNIIIKD